MFFHFPSGPGDVKILYQEEESQSNCSALESGLGRKGEKKAGF
jgi:hypothetical protein